MFNKSHAGGDQAATGPRDRAHGGRFGMLWLTALTFGLARHAEASDPGVAFLDDGNITYKDLEHGSFELVTKEAVPRHFLVEDPGQTIILHTQGSSVSITQSTNSPARMAELQAAQQDALSVYEKGFGSTGSSTPPASDRLPVQPINFIETDSAAPEQDLPVVAPMIFASSSEMIIGHIPPPSPTPPTLNAVLGPTEIDTSIFDVFTASSGTFSATSPNSGATLIFGIVGGTPASTVIDGVSYDVEREGPYGTLFVDSASGAYAFVPDSDAINALVAPTTADFTITVSDGALSADETFTIAINGANDAAIVAGDTSGAAIEAGSIAAFASGPANATGTLTSTDVDNAPNTFTEVSSPTTSVRGFGTFTMTAAGVWTYTIDNANGEVQALNVGDKLTDTFTVTTVDGTPQEVTVTINGANDAAVISGTTTGEVTEDSGTKYHKPTATGTLTAADVDNTPDRFTPVDCPTASDSGYGTFTITADGKWAYVLDDRNCAVQALDDGQTLTDTFTVISIDGPEQVITITINGADDADPNDFDYLAVGRYVVCDPPFIRGTPGADNIEARGHHGLIVYGGAGNDTICVTGKCDVVYAGSGDDRVSGDYGDDKIYGGSGSDVIDGNGGCDTIIGGYGADRLTGGYGDDRFVFLSATDSRAGRYDVITDFCQGSDRIDLRALGTLAFMALTVASTSVPAHTIAWIYDSASDQTIVYVNPTDRHLDIGDTALLEVHLQGFVNVQASDFVPKPDAATAAAESVDPTLVTALESDVAATAAADAATDQPGADDGSDAGSGSPTMQAAATAVSFDFARHDEGHTPSAGRSVGHEAPANEPSADSRHVDTTTSIQHGLEQDHASVDDAAVHHAALSATGESPASQPTESHRASGGEGLSAWSHSESLFVSSSLQQESDDRATRIDPKPASRHDSDAGIKWYDDEHDHGGHGGKHDSGGHGSSDSNPSIAFALFGSAFQPSDQGHSFKFKDMMPSQGHSSGGPQEAWWTSSGHGGNAKSHEWLSLLDPHGALPDHHFQDHSNHHSSDIHDPARSWSGHMHGHDLMV